MHRVLWKHRGWREACLGGSQEAIGGSFALSLKGWARGRRGAAPAEGTACPEIEMHQAA